MNKNVGNADRLIRTLAAIVILFLLLTGTITGSWAIVLGVIAVLLLVTGAIGFCPAYHLLKRSTLKQKQS